MNQNDENKKKAGRKKGWKMPEEMKVVRLQVSLLPRHAPLFKKLGQSAYLRKHLDDLQDIIDTYNDVPLWQSDDSDLALD